MGRLRLRSKFKVRLAIQILSRTSIRNSKQIDQQRDRSTVPDLGFKQGQDVELGQKGIPYFADTG